MRFSYVILGSLALGAIGLGSMGTGCSSDTGGTGGGSSTSSSSGSTSSGTSSSGGLCALGATCKATDKECVGLVDNKGKSAFGLRMIQIDITKPDKLAPTSLVGKLVGGYLGFDDPGCNLNGTPTFNWLFQFDTTAKTLKTGGAKPVTDPNAGYSFVNETINGIAIAPITFADVSPDATGKFSIATGQDLVVPIFLDEAATDAVLLPLKQTKFANVTISASNNCIGSYNANRDPANSCFPDDTHPGFTTGGDLSGIVTLEDADTVPISSLKVSLCVLLAGDAGQAGSGAMAGYTVCKRDASNKIVAQGDTCAAGGSCTDAFSLSAKFAAASIKIN